jgi:hypothetical protein
MLSGFAVGDPYTAGPQFPASRLVENRLRIDTRRLKKAGALKAGTSTVISLQGNPVASLRALPGFQIWATTGSVEAAILLVEDLPMVNCPRTWFQCPGPNCKRRCRYLYLLELRCSRCGGRSGTPDWVKRAGILTAGSASLVCVRLWNALPSWGWRRC